MMVMTITIAIRSNFQVTENVSLVFFGTFFSSDVV